MKIYTKGGDRGETGLFGGTRVSKASLRVSAYGDIDELNCVIGLARTHPLEAGGDPETNVDAWLERIQSELFDLGAELAAKPGKETSAASIDEKQIGALELAIDRAELELTPLKVFVLPGGSAAAAHLHLARTVCRRAERAIVLLSAEEPVRDDIIAYVNRLSDLFFVLARLANHRAGVPDVPWLGRGERLTTKGR